MKTETMRKLSISLIAVLCLGLQACTTEPLTKSEQQAKRDDVRDMASLTLTQLYAANPDAQDAVKNASGYAVFSNFGFKLIFGGGSNGSGIAINNATKQETFMKMIELQPGLGLGASKFKAIYVFQWPEAFNNFVTSGWEFGANAMAAAKTKTEGGAYKGAVQASPGVYVYQLTETGAIVGVSLTGAKFYLDSQLQ